MQIVAQVDPSHETLAAPAGVASWGQLLQSAAARIPAGNPLKSAKFKYFNSFISRVLQAGK